MFFLNTQGTRQGAMVAINKGLEKALILIYPMKKGQKLRQNILISGEINLFLPTLSPCDLADIISINKYFEIGTDIYHQKLETARRYFREFKGQDI